MNYLDRKLLKKEKINRPSLLLKRSLRAEWFCNFFFTITYGKMTKTTMILINRSLLLWLSQIIILTFEKFHWVENFSLDLLIQLSVFWSLLFHFRSFRAQNSFRQKLQKPEQRILKNSNHINNKSWLLFL